MTNLRPPLPLDFIQKLMVPQSLASHIQVPADQAREMAVFMTATAMHKPQDEHARKAYEWAVKLDQQNAEAWNGLGRCALERKDNRGALDFFGKALKIRPAAAPACNTAEALRRLGDMREAEYMAKRALEIDPESVQAYVMLGAIYAQIADEDRSLEAIEKGLEIDPGNDMLRYGMGLIMLARGYYAHGWEDYESREPRLKLIEKVKDIAIPEWQGEFSGVKALLVCREQGIGDEIMFARYLRGLPDGARCFTRPELARFMSQVAPNVTILTSNTELAEFKPDAWVGIGSIPFCVESDGPRRAVKFTPDPLDVERLSTFIPQTGNMCVGLCWAGNSEHPRDDERSLRWADFKAFTEIPGVDFYSFQFGDTDSGIPNPTQYCHDVADTCAALSLMDLVITVDTAVLHMAASVGVQTWALTYTPCDWRWDDRGQSWYEGVRIFRQEKRREWRPVLESVMEALTRSSAEAARESHKLQAVGSSPTSATISTSNTRYGRMNYFAHDKWLGRSLRLYGEWSESEARLFRDLIHEGATVIEAGSNIGTLTVPLSEIVGQSGRVVAFEPCAKTFGLLLTNTSGRKNIGRVNLALGDSQCDIRMAEFNGANPGGHEIDEAGPESARQTTLDSLNYQRCDFLKIDVEGSEMGVLRGAEQTIKRCQPIIYVENDRPNSTETIGTWLAERDYSLYQHFAPLFNADNFAGNRVNVFGGTVSAMLLAVPKERLIETRIVAAHDLAPLKIKRVYR